MGFKLLDVDKFIKEKKAEEVISANAFEKINSDFKPNPYGIYSEQIFGITLKDKRQKYGYINLKTVIMHPLIFNNLKKVSSLLQKVAEGQKYAIIDENGVLQEADEHTGKTGINFIIQNFNKINFDFYIKETNEAFISFLKTIQRKVLFPDKIPVIPVIYRPYRIKNGRVELDEISEKYQKILYKLENKNSIYSSTDNFLNLDSAIDNLLNATMNDKTLNDKLQYDVNQLYDYFISKLEKKQGYFRSKMMGKRLDNVARLVANARPDIPINAAVIPWHVLLNLFDVFVIGYLARDKELAKDLGVSELNITDLGKHLYYIYKNCDIYCKTFPERQDKWIQLLKKIFDENDYLRIMIKRDPGWSASSFWSLKPLIGKGCQYMIVVPMFYYSPLGGDSFNTNIFYIKKRYKENKNYKLLNKEDKNIEHIYNIQNLKKFFNSKD